MNKIMVYTVYDIWELYAFLSPAISVRYVCLVGMRV